MSRRSLLVAVLIGIGVATGYGLALLFVEAPAPVSVRDEGREILYWVAPMDPSFRSDKPGKSPMGMDLIPVYADEAERGAGTALRIEPAMVNNLGVRTAPVERGTLARRIETVGYIGFDDDKVADIDLRVEGWIEDLRVRTEGELVQKGDLLFRIYSRPLIGAQAEYLQALRIGQSTVIAAAGERLLTLGMTREQLAGLRESGEILQRIDIRAPQDGMIAALDVREGSFVEPGTAVMRLADLSSVWVQVDVFEDRIGWIGPGQPARMTLASAPGTQWRGSVDYVYPTIREESRTGRVRLRFDNPGRSFKPGMYASVTIDAAPQENVLHVPREALIRTGRSERVILALGDGRFRPAEVRSGIESGTRVEIREGLAAGERVVTSGQFLIDSEASMRGGLVRMLGGEGEERRHD